MNEAKMNKWKEKGYDIDPLEDLLVKYKISHNDNKAYKAESPIKKAPQKNYFKGVLISIIFLILIAAFVFSLISIKGKNSPAVFLVIEDSEGERIDNVKVDGGEFKKIDIGYLLKGRNGDSMQLNFSKEGYENTSENIVFSAKEETVKIIMEKLYELNINALDSEKKAVSGIDMKITCKDNDFDTLIKADSKGRIRGLMLKKGEYSLKVESNMKTVNLANDTEYDFEIVKKKPVSNKAVLTYLRTNDKGYKEYKNEKDGSVLIYIPAGEFTMGSESGYDSEKPVHKVFLDGYYIMKYEVTNKQYKKFCDETGRSYPSDPGYSGRSSYFTNYPDYPVVYVSWNDAIAYSKWAGLRLPTEAEWEKAARGTDSRTYPWGNGEPGTNRCNYIGSEDGYEYTSPIGSYENGRSPYGCYDMAGNVWEWCSDWYGNNYYRDSEYRNPNGPSSGDGRVLRGGSWYSDANCIRSAVRGTPSLVNYGSGFRCSAAE